MAFNDEVPHIQAECSACSMIFDLKYGVDCPRCHGTGVKWARLIRCATCGDTGNVNGEPCVSCGDRFVYAQAAQVRLRETLNGYVDEQGAVKEIAWLEKLYAL